MNKTDKEAVEQATEEVRVLTEAVEQEYNKLMSMSLLSENVEDGVRRALEFTTELNSRLDIAYTRLGVIEGRLASLLERIEDE